MFLGFRGPLQSRHDTELAKPSIDLALNTVKVMRFVQHRIKTDKGGQKNLWTPRILGEAMMRPASIWEPSKEDLGSFAKDSATAWRADHPLSSLRDSNTVADPIFARFNCPQLQDSFHDSCRADCGAGAFQSFFDSYQFELGSSRERPGL